MREYSKFLALRFAAVLREFDMPFFKDREQAFEAKFAHDEEFRFRIAARRDKLFAGRIASQLQMTGHEPEELTAAVLAVRDGAGHDAKLLGLVEKVLVEHGQRADTPELGALLDDCAKKAEQQLLGAPRPK